MLVSLAILCVSSDAAASGWGTSEGFVVLPGVTLGSSLYHTELDSPGLILGGEVSVWRYDLDGLGGSSNDGYTPSAAGGYVDALWDVGPDALRVSAGPGMAWWFVGIDGGAVLQRRGDLMGYGIAGRLFVSALVPGLFVRVGKTWGGIDDTYVELGLTFKLPLFSELFE
jgi:hypothetical protein